MKSTWCDDLDFPLPIFNSDGTRKTTPVSRERYELDALDSISIYLREGYPEVGAPFEVAKVLGRQIFCKDDLPWIVERCRTLVDMIWPARRQE